MKSQTNKFPCLMLLIAGIAVFLFSSTGISRIQGWNPAASEASVAAVDSAAVTIRATRYLRMNVAVGELLGR